MRRLERWALPAILTLMGTILVLLAAETGVTVDEPAHLLSSYLYWKGADRLQPGDMPPLIKMAAGWVPVALGLPVPPAGHKVWETNHEWNVSLQMMYDLTGPQIRRIFFYSRLPMILFPLGCCVLLWWWGRQLFSPGAGLLVALVFVLSPNVLGHGALIKNDLAASLGYLLFWYRAWKFWTEPSKRSAAWMATALLVAILAKFSLLILVPLAPLILLARGRSLSWRDLAACALLLAAIPYLGLVAAWQFDIGRPTENQFQLWSTDRNVPYPLAPFVRTVSWIPTPVRFWHGAVSLVQSDHVGSAYLMGRIVPGGSPWYFLATLAFKVPRALQVMIILGLVVVGVDVARRRARVADLFWTVPPVLYLALASISSLQLGVRLVLPALVMLILISGRGLAWAVSSRYARVLPMVLVLWQGVRVASAYPHYISFFNQWIGGPDRALPLLSDSNLDWGQDLRRLAEWVAAERIPKIRLAYFGTDFPYAYMTDKVLEPITPPWHSGLVKGERYEPEPGYYAISATLLTGQFFAEKYRDYFACFRDRKPFAKAGYSIFIYRVP